MTATNAYVRDDEDGALDPGDGAVPHQHRCQGTAVARPPTCVAADAPTERQAR